METKLNRFQEKSENFTELKKSCFQNFYLLIQQIEKTDWKNEMKQATNNFNLQQYKLLELDSKSVSDFYKKLESKYRKMENEDGRIYWFQNQLKIFVWLCIATSKVFNMPFESYTETQIKKITSSFLYLNQGLAIYQYKLLTLIGFDQEWKEEEQTLLVDLVKKYDYNGSWTIISKQLFLESGNIFLRAGHSCRQRWQNHLDNRLVKGQWSLEQDYSLIKNVIIIGKKWSVITKIFDRVRNQHMIKNRYNTILKKQSPKKTFKAAEQIQICKMIEHKLFLQLSTKNSGTPTFDATATSYNMNSDQTTINHCKRQYNTFPIFNQSKKSFFQIKYQEDPLANSIKLLNQYPDKFMDVFFQKTFQSNCFKFPQLDNIEIPDDLRLIEQDFNQQSYPIIQELEYESLL